MPLPAVPPSAPGARIAKSVSGTAIGVKDTAGIIINPFALSTAYRYWYPWIKDTSRNVIDKSGHADGAVWGTATTNVNSGYFTSVAGTYGQASGTGRHWETAASGVNPNRLTDVIIIHMGINKAAPGGTENIGGHQHASTNSSGWLFIALANGNYAIDYKPGTVQNSFTQIAAFFDGTDHQITIIQDPATGYISLYVDGVFRQTKTDIDYSGTPSAAQNFVHGGYSATAAYDAKFFNCHMIAVPNRNLADLPLGAQGIVDKLTLLRLPLSPADLGI